MEFNSFNPELKTTQICMSEHAYKQAKERFNMKSNNEILGYFRSALKTARYIGNVTSEDGNDSVLYAQGRIAIHLSPDLKTIITVYKHEYVTFSKIKNMIELMHFKEINKLERLERSKVKKLRHLKLKLAIEIAQLDYRYENTRSQNVRTYCINRKKEIQDVIKNQEDEINEIKSIKRQVAKSLVAVI